MTKFKQSLLTAALAATILFTLSCSDGGGGNPAGSEPIKKASIKGVSQKGPFVEGSKATLYELNESFVQTGKSFTDIIADNKGTFEIKSIELVSPYAMLEASGYYRNENTGKVSTAPITLFAIADVREKDQVNVNILTHLEYYRVLNLVESGKSVKDAKKQAQKEIFAVFGIDSDSFKDSEDMSIFGTSESDAALLAISVLLQSDLSEGEFSQRLTNFAQAIKTGGDWNNDAAKNAMTDWAASADLASIKNNILGWELSPAVPDFEKYVNDYWNSNYGIGVCNAGLQDNIKKSNKEIYYICKNNSWRTATEFEYDTYGLVCSTELEIKDGQVSGKKYVCEYGNWRPPRYIDMKCFESKNCSIFTDARDNRSYFYVEIGEQTWMAENLDYDSECVEDYCREHGQDYDWITAKTICPDGWHLPTKAEWDILFKYVASDFDCNDDYCASSMGGKKLIMTSCSNCGGTDDYGFSAFTGMSFCWGVMENGDSYFCSISSGSGNAIYCRGDYGDGLYPSSRKVRCVKD
jgi:uncharacterized protein (TIGR02145 family)